MAPGAAITNAGVQYRDTTVLGVPVLSAELRGPAADRPVMQAWYELSHDNEHSSDKEIIERFSQHLGRPHWQQQHSVKHYPNRSNGVRCVAEWRFGGIHLGLSIFGLPRSTEHGLTCASLYADWDDELAAAAPYLSPAITSDAKLASASIQASHISVFDLESQQAPFYLENFRNADSHLARSDQNLRRAQACLHRRNLVVTPPRFAEQLKPNQVVVWENTPQHFWCLSTKWDSAVIPTTERPTAQILDLVPAKCGGATYLTLGDLCLKDQAHSSAINHLVHFIGSAYQVSVKRSTDYDS